MSTFLYSYGLSLTQSLGKRLKPAKTSSTPKRIHNFRLTVKRLRALIRLLDSISHEPSHDFLFKPLKKTYGKTGSLRDLHVQRKLIKNLKKQSTKEAGRLMILVERKEARVNKNVFKEFAKLNSKAIKQIQDYFEEHLLNGYNITSEDCMNFIGLKIDAIKQLAGIDYEDKVLHSIRKHLKDVVYTLQLLQMQESRLNIPERTLKWFNDLQEKLGVWNDWYNFTQMLRQLNSKKTNYSTLEWLSYIEKDKCKQSISECLQNLIRIDDLGIILLKDET